MKQIKILSLMLILCGIYILYNNFSAIATFSPQQTTLPPPPPPTPYDPAAWCAHISSTPEPQLLLYNRIPKAGGTTMLEILNAEPRAKKGIWDFAIDDLNIKTSRNHPITSYVFGSSSGLWGDHRRKDYPLDAETNTHLLGRVQKTISTLINNHNVKTHTKGVANGHFFPLLPGIHTYFNIMRQPAKRAESSFYFNIHDSEGAKIRREAKNATMLNREFLEWYSGGVSKLDESCFKSEKCRRVFEGECKLQTEYLCGGENEGGECGGEGLEVEVSMIRTVV